MSKKIKCALIGPGNIGTDLLAKLQRSPVLEPVWMVGIDPESDGLKRAREMGIKTTAEGVDGLIPHMKADGVQIVFDATSAYVHAENSRKVNEQGAMMIDLTPAAIGTDDHLKMAHGLGVHTIRVATHCTEADVSEQHITYARQLDMDVVGFLMM
ncbi:MAG: acetaldehyde dehydrogenase (acetylating), partial [Hydrogenophaga sp.]|nr:acetaldehyde dehydrogenase (acetylating) [Hydrogenophaga sp.]